MSTYQNWLTKLRKRARPSGAVSQWSQLLSQKQGGDPEMWRDHILEILEDETRASLDLVLDLDLITAPAKKVAEDDTQPKLF